ncbi:MAG: hypothetical protein HY721_05360, partial [Planctomycetes bacterium]|nr:hypothetical protein [Planctomycetota bacterium]
GAAGPGEGGRAGGASLYAREAGPGPRFVVSYETDSRKDAEEALSLLKAHLRSR